MKHFIFVVTKSTHRRNAGGFNEEAWIYRMKRNVPDYITSVKWCTAGYKGSTSAVMNKLAEEGHIPKKHNGYYQQSSGDFKITEVG